MYKYRILGIAILLSSFLTGTAAYAQGVLYVENERVGIGQATPGAPLEIVATPTTVGVGNAVGLFRKPGALAFQLDDTDVAGFWNFSVAAAENEFRISRSGTGARELTLTAAGDMIITGTLTTGGATCSGGCDRVFSSDFALETIDEHAEQMWSNSYLPAIGPTRPFQPFNLTEKTGGIVNELEKAHIYIEQLHKRLEAKERTIDDVLTRLEKLEAENAR